MTTQIAAARQPFAPISSSRLQNLTSLKNSQNAITSTLTSPSKRKAESFDFENSFDAENIDPSIFLSPKRSKALDGSSKDASTFTKPTNFFLTRTVPAASSPLSSTTPRRPILEARSPIKKLNTTIKNSPLSAPAGRSPTRKRIGILNRRKTASPFTRIDPPKFSQPPSSTSGLGFSIDAALSGTIPSYSARQKQASSSSSASLPIPELHQPESKAGWFFDIHEDTPEEEATNLMEHSTCTLDISSDEESAARARDERGKENVPPPDDISQTRTLLTAASSVDAAESSMSDIKARIRASRKKCEEAIEIDRSPLGDLAAEDFYAEGCDGSSVFLVPSEEEEEVHEETAAPVEEEVPVMEETPIVEEIISTPTFDFTADIKGKGKEINLDLDLEVEALMTQSNDDIAPKAALLEPIEKAEENFELWESGSAKDGE